MIAVTLSEAVQALAGTTCLGVALGLALARELLRRGVLA